jgi:hypothetical protein
VGSAVAWVDSVEGSAGLAVALVVWEADLVAWAAAAWVDSVAESAVLAVLVEVWAGLVVD